MRHAFSNAMVEGCQEQIQPRVLDRPLSVDGIKSTSKLAVVGCDVQSGRAIDFFLKVTGLSSSGASPKDSNPTFLSRDE